MAMIWTHFICKNFIVFGLNTKQLLAPHIPFLRNTSPPSPWSLTDDLTEPFFRGVAIPPTDRHLCSFLATAEAPYPTEHSAACRYFQSTNCRQPTLNIWRCNAFPYTGTTWSTFAHDNRLPFFNSCPCTRPPHSVIIEQLIRDMHD